VATTAERLLDWLEAHRREMVELLERLALAESPTLVPETQAGPFRILAAELERDGFLVRRIRGVGVGDHLYARPRNRAREAPRQLLLGHMDTVWPVGTLARMPLHEREGNLYGPGVADMKGGLVEIVFALRALRELGLEPPVTPVVLVSADEETGSHDSGRYVRLLAQGAVRALVLESGEGAGGDLKIARKGLGRFTVTVEGRSSHAGADFEQGISAILELTHQVQHLFALNDPARGITVNVGTIDGGLRPNVVAARASALVDVRVPTAAVAQRVEEAIRRLTPVLAGAVVDVEGGWHRPPMEALPRNRTLLATALRLGRDVGLSLRDAGLVGGGSDANTTSLFTATLDGLGPVGEGSHARDERVDTLSWPNRTALLGLLLLEPDTRPKPVRHERPRAAGRRAGRSAPRLAVLGTDASVTNVLLTRTWSSLGVDAVLLGPDEAPAWLREGDTVLGRLDVLPTLDGVERGLLELLWLERRGLRVLNPAAALVAAHDKLVTARLLARAGLPHPRTEHLRPHGEVPDLGLPIVIKPRLGSWGVDVFRCETEEELERALADVRSRPWFQRYGALVQELVPPAGYDLRLVVAGGAVVGAVRRVAAPGEWRTNVSLGGSRRRARPSAAAAALGIAAAAAIGADLVGVDLLPAGDSYTVIELNGAVDFDGAYSLPGGDVLRDTARALGLLPASGPAARRGSRSPEQAVSGASRILDSAA
jgi:glutamate carboxypeptidase